MKKMMLFCFILCFFHTTAFSKDAIPTSPFEYAADFNTTWNALVNFCAQENMPIKNMEKDSGFINTNFIESTAAIFPVRYTISFVVNKINEQKTSITVTPYIAVEGMGYNVSEDKDFKKSFFRKYGPKLSSLLPRN